MQNALLLATKLQKLGKVDRRFFLICGIIIAVIVAVYFLIPVFRREQYEIQRNNLRERELFWTRVMVMSVIRGVNSRMLNTL